MLKLIKIIDKNKTFFININFISFIIKKVAKQLLFSLMVVKLKLRN